MRVAPDFLAPLLRRLRRSRGLRRLLPDFLQRPGQAARRDRADAGLVAGRQRCACAIASTIGWTICFPASTAAAGPALSTGTSFWSWAASTRCWRRSTWKTPISATWRGSAAGRCCTSRAAWCITSIAAPSARRFRAEQIQRVLKKNFLLFCWKNIHEWPRLAPHFFFTWAGAVLSGAVRRAAGRPNLAAIVAGLPAASAGGALALAGAGAGGDRRYRSVPAAAGRLFPRSLRADGARAGAAARAVRLALPDLSAGARRRRLHVPDAARDGEAGRGPRAGAAGLAMRRQKDNEELRDILRVGGVAGAAERAAEGHGVAAAARGARVRQRRSGVADPPPALPTADRRAAARIHAAGAVRGEFRRIATRAVRARCVLPIDRARPGAHDRARWTRRRRGSNICARCATSCGVLPAFDQVQVCTPANRDYLLGFLPELAPRMRDGLRAGIDTSRYEFRPRRARAAHHAVPGQLPARPESGGGGLVRARTCCR